MEILTEFDGLQEALKKVKMDENVLPYVNGRLCDTGAWNKTQKILGCPEMISAHKYLYNLDMDQLTEEEIAKIDQLYKLGCDRGFIVDDLTDWDSTETPDSAEQNVEKSAEKPVEEKPVEKPVGGTLFKAKIPCWTVIYSATSKDGDIKTGEAYSNAISAAAAKADVNAKLSGIGYSNISILAIESTNGCDCQGCANNEIAEADDEKEKSADENNSEDSSSDNTNDSSNEESDDDSGENDSSDSTSDDSDEDSNEESDDSSSSKEDSDDSNSDDSSDDASDDSDDEDKSNDEDSEDDSEDNSKDEEKEELDANKKAELKDKYRKAFKNTLIKCKFDTSFNDLTLEQKVKFFTELSKAWKKNEPTEFMTDKEVEQLNNIVAKPGNEE